VEDASFQRCGASLHLICARHNDTSTEAEVVTLPISLPTMRLHFCDECVAASDIETDIDSDRVVTSTEKFVKSQGATRVRDLKCPHISPR